jgi:hypothetical protein
MFYTSHLQNTRVGFWALYSSTISPTCSLSRRSNRKSFLEGGNDLGSVLQGGSVWEGILGFIGLLWTLTLQKLCEGGLLGEIIWEEAPEGLSPLGLPEPREGGLSPLAKCTGVFPSSICLFEIISFRCRYCQCGFGHLGTSQGKDYLGFLIPKSRRSIAFTSPEG